MKRLKKTHDIWAIQTRVLWLFWITTDYAASREEGYSLIREAYNPTILYERDFVLEKLKR